jgi:hypothetical protein
VSNPFTSVVISGYNSSPPADDGSAIATNQLQWSKHKTKLGDPLKTAIESINANVIAAFGKRIGTTISAHSANYQIVPGDQGKFFSVTGTTTITLATVADAGDGFLLWIVNSGSGIVTVDGSGAETINGFDSLALYPRDALLVTCNGTAWEGTLIPGVEEGSFTGTFAVTVAPGTGTIKWRRHGRKVKLWCDSTIFGVSNGTSHTMTGLPASLQPTGTRRCSCSVYDNGSEFMGQAILSNGIGTIIFRILSVSVAPGNVFPSSSNFTGSGNKGLIDGWSIEYVI